MIHRPASAALRLAAFGLALTVGAAEAQTSLRVADSFPTTHFISTEGAAPFMEAAKRLSGGSLDFAYFPTQQLGAAADMLELTASASPTSPMSRRPTCRTSCRFRWR